MRAPHQLLHSRTRIRSRYCLFPLEGYPPSKLPDWPGVEARILTSPAMGAGFAQYLLDVKSGQQARGRSDGRIETFFYVLSGEVRLVVNGNLDERLTPGGFALVSADGDYRLSATSDARLLMLRKAYERLDGVAPPPSLVGHESKVKAEPFLGDDGARLQTLIPDEPAFDLAMNVFEFAPAHRLPYIETHVMEHGLYFLQGQGLYYLDGEWMEVEATDFIWMGPYCPQSFYATGPTPSKYIYYKNVNRDVPL
jgi:(S)-ureidoglycine aminohydrolase